MEVTHKQLGKMIDKAYETKRPLFIAGTTGIGKSYVVKNKAKAYAEQEKRDFVEWNKISDTEKLDIIDNQAKEKKTFIFADLRISQSDPSDLKGLPKLNGKNFVEWKPNLLFRAFSMPNIKGVLFFDELNLAPPSVQASAYQIILDKSIGELSLNPDICILAAGNRVEDMANVFDMAAPLKNRFSHVTLQIPTFKDWVDWALDNGVDDRIVAYIQFKPAQLMIDMSKLKKHKSNSFNTPRSWEFASSMINGEENLDDIQMFISSTVGDGIAIEFSAWLKLKQKVDLNRILEHPEQAEGLELDMKWSLISAVSEKFRADKKILNKALGVCHYLEPDFSASLLRMLKRQNDKEFMKQALTCKNFDSIFKKYGKYIIKKD